MELKDYFENTTGLGVLATADGEGKVNAAVYARPHFMEEGNIAFIMADRLSHKNLQSNPHAHYLFRENTGGYNGKRLYLTKVGEVEDRQLIDELARKKYGEDKARFLVYFKIDNVLPLIGNGESA